MRELPRGAMSRREAMAFVAVCGGRVRRCGVPDQRALRLAVAGGAGHRVLVLAGQALHRTTRRPSSGWRWRWRRWADGSPPAGGGGWTPWLLGLAIGLWVGGFDVIYACQDVAVDRAHGLKSIPVRFGIARALAISRAMHVATVVAMASLALVAPLGPIYLAGVALVAALLAYEQSLVSADDLSQRAKRAFDLNGYVGILYLVTTAVALYVD